MNTSQIIPLHKEQPDFPVNHKELAEFLGLDSETVTYYIEGKRGNFCFSNTTDFYRQVSLKTDRGRPAVIYWLTINSAKEICMLAEGDKGKQARLYFIECERVAKAPQGPTNFLEAMKLIVAKEEERLALEATVNVQAEQLAIQAPKVDAWEKLMNAEGGSNPSTASKAFTEFGIGPKSIYPCYARVWNGL